MNTLRVRHVDGDRFAIAIRGHVVLVDQPVADGGEDTAPTPTELFVAGLVSCVGFYARRYLARHDLPTGGLTVTGSWTMASRPARVDRIHIELALPDGVPAERRDALLAVASHCTVHNTLVEQPDVEVTLTSQARAA